MPEELAATSPTFACAELIRRAAGAWSAATAHRNAVALSGAIRDLGMYTNQVGPGVRLGTEFQNMVRGLDRLRKATPPNPPPPIRFEEMEAILAATKNSTKDANKLAQQSATWDTPLQQQWNSEV